MEYNSQLAKKIITPFGPSGREEGIAAIIAEEIKGYVDEVRVDALGNLIAHKKGTGKKLMFAAHIDQIGLMVTDTDDKGFVRFTPVGGFSPHRLLDQRVVFANGVQGVVSAEKIEDYGKLSLDKMYIDVAALSKEEAQQKVSIGDMCVMFPNYYENDKCVMSGALDDRIGAYILIEAIKAQKNAGNDCYYVFTVQEEVGLRGAKTSGYAIDPDICVALDVTGTGDCPNGVKMAVKLGGGAAIKIKDASILCHPAIKKLMTERAIAHGIKYQYEILEFGGTDSGAVHLSRGGVPSGVISIPTRWLHGPNETAAKADIVECVKLVLALAEEAIEI